MGLLKFSPKGLQRVGALWKSLSGVQRDRLDMTSMLGMMIRMKYPVHGVPIQFPWGEVDTSEDLALYERKDIKA